MKHLFDLGVPLKAALATCFLLVNILLAYLQGRAFRCIPKVSEYALLQGMPLQSLTQNSSNCQNLFSNDCLTGMRLII